MSSILGALVLGEYRVEHILDEDAAWVHLLARTQTHAKVELRLLQPGVRWGGLVDELFTFFDALGNLPKKHLLLPTHIIGDGEFPLVLAFDAGESVGLGDYLGAHPDKSSERWHEATEALHALHNRGLVAGFVAPEGWKVRGGRTMLDDLGTAPILQNGPREVRAALVDRYAAAIAPEVRGGSAPSKTGDVWSLAACAARIHHELAHTVWWAEATSPDPVARPRTMRLAWSGLELALQSLGAAADPPPLEASAPKKGALVPKFEVQARAEPADGGEVAGVGNFAAGAKANLTASANHGWEFVGWSGDKVGQDAQLRFDVEAPCALVAHFQRLARREFPISAQIEPPHAGEVLGVGRYFVGDRATIRAHAHTGWRFAGWAGGVALPWVGGVALSQSEHELSWQVTAPLEVTARFERAPNFAVVVSAEPPEGGQVRGAGTFTQGADATLKAVPAPLWRFSHWSGAALGTKNPLTLTVESDTSLSAHFARSLWDETQSQDQPTALARQPATLAARLGSAFGTSKTSLAQPTEPAPPEPASAQEPKETPPEKPRPKGLGKAFGG